MAAGCSGWLAQESSSWRPLWCFVVDDIEGRVLYAFESEEHNKPRMTIQLPAGAYTVGIPKKPRKNFVHCLRIDLDAPQDGRAKHVFGVQSLAELEGWMNVLWSKVQKRAFKLAFKIKGESLVCQFQEGECPAQVARDFGAQYNFQEKRITKIEAAIRNEAQRREMRTADGDDEVEEPLSPLSSAGGRQQEPDLASPPPAAPSLTPPSGGESESTASASAAPVQPTHTAPCPPKPRAVATPVQTKLAPPVPAPEVLPTAATAEPTRPRATATQKAAAGVPKATLPTTPALRAEAPAAATQRAEKAFKMVFVVRGEQVECVFERGADPTAVADELATKHGFSAKRTRKIEAAMRAEAGKRGMLVAAPVPAQSKPAPAIAPTPAASPKPKPKPAPEEPSQDSSNGTLVPVVCPPGTVPGDVVRVNVGVGVEVEVTIPEGMVPGDEFDILIPNDEPSNAAQCVTVRCPLGALEGDVIVVEDGAGGHMEVDIPSGVGPGDEFDVMLAPAGTMEDKLAARVPGPAVGGLEQAYEDAQKAQKAKKKANRAAKKAAKEARAKAKKIQLAKAQEQVQAQQAQEQAQQAQEQEQIQAQQAQKQTRKPEPEPEPEHEPEHDISAAKVQDARVADSAQGAKASPPSQTSPDKVSQDGLQQDESEQEVTEDVKELEMQHLFRMSTMLASAHGTHYCWVGDTPMQKEFDENSEQAGALWLGEAVEVLEARVTEAGPSFRVSRCASFHS